ncbi:MAG: amino acid racemase [Coriobacteriaceae bacterium]|nr:amino acid racemase [Coriobacteriaceae bacterium]
MDKPVLGVLGGVGPLATAYFMELVIKKTPAERDQDNIPMIVFNDPQIPDRTSYILDRNNPDPLPEMERVVLWLENAGADYIAIPCNTAHFFYEQISDAASIPVLNIMRETTTHIVETYGAHATIGLLATDGTVASGVFQSYLSDAGLSVVTPSAKDQADIVMPLIYERIKRNLPYDPAAFLDLARRMHEDGCDAVIVGCTELSVVYQDLANKPSYLIDSMDVLAGRCVQYYLEHHRH